MDNPDGTKMKQDSPLPTATLPKGGGAIAGMGDKFSVNPVTGTGGTSIPIATSPGRTGFGPSFQLSYDSGAGNGPFGFGWSLSTPAVTRQTSRRLPQYRDEVESDAFMLSGSDDLVPALNGDGSAVQKGPIAGYRIKTYRRRTEHDFARIERWTNLTDSNDVHWRVTSGDDLLSIYGLDPDSRLQNSDDPSQVYSWLVSETRDNRGNAIKYFYKREDDAGVDQSMAYVRGHRYRNNLYLKAVKYGNSIPLLDDQGNRPHFLSTSQLTATRWFFEVVLDYGEHDTSSPTPGDSLISWDYRPDAFSTYRAGFEIRTARLCKRVLMFHHFEQEPNVGLNCLVRSTDFTYDKEANTTFTFLTSTTQIGYMRSEAGSGYTQQAAPPVDFQYSHPSIDDRMQPIDSSVLENMTAGTAKRFCDLYGEGIPGVLRDDRDAWRYSSNESPLNKTGSGDNTTVLPAFSPEQLVKTRPNMTANASLIPSIEGDGFESVLDKLAATTGFYEQDGQGGWRPFQSFRQNINQVDKSAKTVQQIDLNGDGTLDSMIAGMADVSWHPSYRGAGYGAGQYVSELLEDGSSPQRLFTSQLESVFLADFSGDGLRDIVRVRNGEVCYWPNLGFGQFGRKITMDNVPFFDNADQFNRKQLLMVDIDGSGTTDMIYFHRDGIRLYFNICGNTWSDPYKLTSCVRLDSSSVVEALDLLGNGTACLVISSKVPGSSVSYVNLMGSQKPHLLVSSSNNLGASSKYTYTSSTEFYLRDKRSGSPWVTRLPFPVHVVERVELYDLISKNKFTTRYAYHHGCYDVAEREFRGFGMVETWDSEDIASIQGPEIALAIPPVHTKTWFHNGVLLNSDIVSRQYITEYFQSPDLAGGSAWLLPDSVLPDGLPEGHERDAMRAFKGSVLRREVYANDAAVGSEKAHIPYTITETNYSLSLVQPRHLDSYPIFKLNPRESIDFHFERNLQDPRISHSMTLLTSPWGHPLKALSIAYGRQIADSSLPLDEDRAHQAQTVLIYTENDITNVIDDTKAFPYNYRLPVNCGTRSYELTGFTKPGSTGPFAFSNWADSGVDWFGQTIEIPYQTAADYKSTQRRLIKNGRKLFRKDTMDGLMSYGLMGALALQGKEYHMAATSDMISQTFSRDGKLLLNNIIDLLTDQSTNGGGYVSGSTLKRDGLFPSSDPDNVLWSPSGQTYFASGTDSGQELREARQHFFLPKRYMGPLSTQSMITYDQYDLLVVDTQDALGSHITIGDRDANGTILNNGNNYRVLLPYKSTDANRNRAELIFDELGKVVAHAIKGKMEESLGDTIDDFKRLDRSQILSYLENPRLDSDSIVGKATSVFLYDLFAFLRTKNTPSPQPARTCSIMRSSHYADLKAGEHTEITHQYAYSDGFGRTIQSKSQTSRRDPDSPTGDRRTEWIASGWTIFNMKGDPTRQYDRFFSSSPNYEPNNIVGVSPVILYDPLRRPVASLFPDGTYTKTLNNPWKTTTWDANDTILSNPYEDPDLSEYVATATSTSPHTTWYAMRKDGAMGSDGQAAAAKAAAHAETPSSTHLDSLGRQFLMVTHNKVRCAGHDMDNTESKIYSRVDLDVEGQQRRVRDGLDRVITKMDYDMLGNRPRSQCMEKGYSWILNNVAGKAMRVWNNRGHMVRTEYDVLGRSIRTYVSGDILAPSGASSEVLVNRMIYGEAHPASELQNLRGSVYLSLDQSGASTNFQKDFKGNTLRKSQRFCIEYKKSVDWSDVDQTIPTDAAAKLDLTALEASLGVKLGDDAFESSATYNANNLMITSTAPNSSTGLPSTIRMSFKSGQVISADAILSRETAGGVPVWTPFVKALDYNARGQRTLIEYGNGVRTSCEYDNMKRLTRILTQRSGSSKPESLQDLSYLRDPSGNVVQIQDASQQTIFFRNQIVEPTTYFTYDATYRLVESVGREHLGSEGGAPIPYGPSDSQRASTTPATDNAMGRYTEQFVYDNASNMLKMKHASSDPSKRGWTKAFEYIEASQIEPSKMSNRLSSTNVGTIRDTYKYDTHGNTTRFPHLGGSPPENVVWDFMDRVKQVDLGGGGKAYYVYNLTGDRVRKVVEKAPNLSEERLYLGDIEFFRRRRSGEVSLERETLHFGMEQQRMVLCENKTKDLEGRDPSPQRLIRFQLTSHLNSSAIEVDGDGRILTFEEFSAYGNTTYQASAASLETPKRYRFTGKERDEETGFSYHGARFLAPWLARWISTDPTGIADNANLYCYVSANPINHTDGTGTSAETEFSHEGLDIKFDLVPNRVPLNNQVAIDEVMPVGTKVGVSIEEQWWRATSAENRTFRQFNDNSYTKHGRYSNEPTSTGRVSLAEQPSAWSGRRISQVEELNTMWERIIASTPREGLTPGEYKEIVNSKFHREAAHGNSPEAKRFRQALEETGFGYKPEVGLSGSPDGDMAALKQPPPPEGSRPEPIRGSSFGTTKTEPTGSAPHPAAPEPAPAPAPSAPRAPAPEARPAVGPRGPRGATDVRVLGGAVVGGMVALGAVGSAINSLEAGRPGEAVENAAIFAVATKVPVVGYALMTEAAMEHASDPIIVDTAVAVGMAVTKSTGSNALGNVAAVAVGTAHAVVQTVAYDMLNGALEGLRAIGRHL